MKKNHYKIIGFIAVILLIVTIYKSTLNEYKYEDAEIFSQEIAAVKIDGKY